MDWTQKPPNSKTWTQLLQLLFSIAKRRVNEQLVKHASCLKNPTLVSDDFAKPYLCTVQYKLFRQKTRFNPGFNRH